MIVTPAMIHAIEIEIDNNGIGLRALLAAHVRQDDPLAGLMRQCIADIEAHMAALADVLAILRAQQAQAEGVAA